MDRRRLLFLLVAVLLLFTLFACASPSVNGDPTETADGGAGSEEGTEKGSEEDTGSVACHVWGAWVTLKEPTCELSGERTRTCEHCGKTESDQLPYLSHEYTEWSVTRAPTCTERGEETRTCKRCGVTKTRSLRAVGHTLGAWEGLNDAGCRTAGWRYRACSVCAYTEEETLPPTGHKWGRDNVCTACNARGASTEGLSFTQLPSGDGYAVSGYGGKDVCVVIPAYHKGQAVKKIGAGAFAGCDALLSVTLPTHLSSIGDGAFDGCRRLCEVINDSALSLRKGSSTYGGIALRARQIHRGESLIREAGGCFFFVGDPVPTLLAYRGDAQLLTLPERFEGAEYQIGRYAFENCTSLALVTVPNGVQRIGKGAFAGCTGLVGVTLGASLSEIGEDAFLGCYKLTEVINRSSLPIVKGESAYGFVAANALAVHGGETQIVHEGEYLFYSDGEANYLLRYLGSETVLTLPEGFGGAQYQLRAYALFGAEEVTAIVLGEGVNAVGVSALGGCDALEAIYYRGSADAWASVAVAAGNGVLDGVTVYLYSETAPTGEGRYWRSLNGVPAPW